MASTKAVSSFDQLNLDERINKAITVCGYKEPTPIQAQSIPPILDNKDLIACAQTGSGKTAAFVLPSLQMLCENATAKKTRVLILTPTRELANQITKAVSTYGKFMKLNTAVLVGGMPYHQQIKDLARSPDIIVATPGRLLDHLEQRRVDLSGIEMLVLDEADRMLDMGFIDDVQYIAKLTPSGRQTLLFSATIGKELANIVRNLMKNPVRIDLSDEKISTPKIKQEFYKVNGIAHKNKLLKHFLLEGNIYKAIIFSATKINTDKLAQLLRDDGFSAGSLHGDLRQNVRTRTVEQLRDGKIQSLVATDVAARGIDIRDVTHVFNYDLPRFSEDYVHRIGRTGRAGKTGIAISFVGPADAQHLQRIERYTGQRVKMMPDITINDAAIKKVEGSGRKVLSIDTAHEFDKEGGEQRRKKFSSPKKRFGAKGGDRPDRAFRSDRSDRPARTERSDRPDGAFRTDRSERPARMERSDRPDRAFRTDRSERSERPVRARTERSDRPDRAFRTDRSERSERPVRARTERSDRPDRAFRTDRSERSERPVRAGTERSDRAFRSDRSDRPERSERAFRTDRTSSDKPKRKFAGKRDSFPSASRGEGAGNSRRSFEKKPFGKKRAPSGNEGRGFKKRSIAK